MFYHRQRTMCQCQQLSVYSSSNVSSSLFTAVPMSAAVCLQQCHLQQLSIYSSSNVSSCLLTAVPMSAVVCLQQCHLQQLSVYISLDLPVRRLDWTVGLSVMKMTVEFCHKGAHFKAAAYTPHISLTFVWAFLTLISVWE